jgi:lipopolysaccharide transport system ATP-binding protein
LRDSLTDLIHVPLRHLSLARRPDSSSHELLRPDGGHIWALKDVSLEVNQGEVLGVIGRNGAGKTTLLKILSRITEPTEGLAEIHGRVGSLLEVGTGFHPELTGRENIYLNGAILGMKRVEIDRKFDEIVDFAEIEKFIDTPVKRYSSGMYVRLAFAVAAHLEPEILLVDEVLAVGDAGFQDKCLRRMKNLRDDGTTVLLVSHNMSSILSLCSRVLWLDSGLGRRNDRPNEVVKEYLDSMRVGSVGEFQSLEHESRRHGDGSARVTRVRIYESETSESGLVRSGQDVNVEIWYRAAGNRELRDVTASVTIENQIQQRLAFCQNTSVGREFSTIAPEGVLVCTIRRLPLTPGQYSLSLGLWVDGVAADGIYQALSFEVSHGCFYPTGILPAASYGNVLLDHDWRWQPSSKVLDEPAVRQVE